MIWPDTDACALLDGKASTVQTVTSFYLQNNFYTPQKVLEIDVKFSNLIQALVLVYENMCQLQRGKLVSCGMFSLNKPLSSSSQFKNISQLLHRFNWQYSTKRISITEQNESK